MRKSAEEKKGVCGMTIEEKNEMMSVIERVCEKYQFTCREQFGIVYIATKFERWHFKMYAEGQRVRLMHQNSKGRHFAEWHEQFTQSLSYSELIQYIYEHERAKYYPGFINPTILRSHHGKAQMV